MKSKTQRIIGYIVLLNNEIWDNLDLFNSIEEAKRAIEDSQNSRDSFDEGDEVTINPVLAPKLQAEFNGVTFSPCED